LRYGAREHRRLSKPWHRAAAPSEAEDNEFISERTTADDFASSLPACVIGVRPR
jgi:hypothetical protein